MSKILLDTNAYSLLFKGDEFIAEQIDHSAICYLSVFVVGELFSGFRQGSRFDKNMNFLNSFMNLPNVKFIDSTFRTAEMFGEIKADLKIKGTPIPANDIWIAAHAIETNSRLITFDKHFRAVNGLLQ